MVENNKGVAERLAAVEEQIAHAAEHRANLEKKVDRVLKGQSEIKLVLAENAAVRRTLMRVAAVGGMFGAWLGVATVRDLLKRLFE